MSTAPEPQNSGELDGSSSSSSADERDEEPLVESLVAGRSKRVTAGNRLTSLLVKEADDELELLFAEDGEEEDVEFEGEEGEDASDVQLDSSSDDEDQAVAADRDDLEGERELQKQDKAERRKKRKAQEIFKRPPALRKRPKLEENGTLATLMTPAMRAKKKSERVSWLPAPEEGPVRSSSRKQTVQNKEVVHQRMQESEKRRRRQVHVMEAAAKRKEVAKAKVMTQADRMAEAARTEKRNAKSLNRWEQTEKKRVEEQKARLAALHNRQLQGPVISWWSGPSKWINGKLVAVGSKNMGADFKPPIPVNEKADGKISISKSIGNTPTGSNNVETTEAPLRPPAGYVPFHQYPLATPASASQIYSAPPPARPEFLDGIHYYASLPHSQQPTVSGAQGFQPVHIGHPMSYFPSLIPVTEISTRNLVILKNIDGTADRTPELQNHVLLRKKNQKLPRRLAAWRWTMDADNSAGVTHISCAITGHPARYRDPKTGLPYANSYAYKEIQKLRRAESRWSSLLGCYVGPIASAASGVPDQFLRRP